MNIHRYRHTLKSIAKKLEEKKQKFSFSKLDLSLSVHMQSAVLLPLPIQQTRQHAIGPVEKFSGKAIIYT